METNFTKFDELNDFAVLLLENGYTLIIADLRDGEKPTWLHFSKDNKIGYVQWEKYRGARFSTTHRPCKECGTGFSLQDYLEYTDLTLQNAESTFITAPNWAKPKDIKHVVKYSSVDDFVKGERILKQYVVTPDQLTKTVNNA